MRAVVADRDLYAKIGSRWFDDRPACLLTSVLYLTDGDE
jgi:hypothetical protein